MDFLLDASSMVVPVDVVPEDVDPEDVVFPVVVHAPMDGFLFFRSDIFLAMSSIVPFAVSTTF